MQNTLQLATTNTGYTVASDNTGYTIPPKYDFNAGHGIIPININNDVVIKFEDGTECTGKELSSFIRIMKKITEDQFPEELV